MKHKRRVPVALLFNISSPPGLKVSRSALSVQNIFCQLASIMWLTAECLLQWCAVILLNSTSREERRFRKSDCPSASHCAQAWQEVHWNLCAIGANQTGLWGGSRGWMWKNLRCEDVWYADVKHQSRPLWHLMEMSFRLARVHLDPRRLSSARDGWDES